MSHPDPGPLLSEHLDELELICQASERGGKFDTSESDDLGSAFTTIDYVLGWHDRHNRQLLEAARWALENGWQRPTKS